MKRYRFIFALAGALALGLASTLITRADDKAKTEAPKAAATYTVCCPSPCDFCVAGHDKAEVAAIVKEHAKSHHNMDLKDKDVEGMMKVTEPKK